MSDFDTVIIGKKARPFGAGGGEGRQGPTALERARAVGAVTENDRKGEYTNIRTKKFLLAYVY